MAPLNRTARISIAAGLAIGILTLDVVLPAQRLAFALAVPLVVLARVAGLRAAIAVACGGAIVVRGFELGMERTAPTAAHDVLPIVLTAAVWTTVLYVVEHYEDVLVRSYRTSHERLARELPAAVRAEEAIVRERDFAAIAEAIPQLVWRASGDGVAEYFNAAWISYTGFDHAALRDASIEATIHPADLERARERWENALALGARFECEYRLRRSDGTYRWFLARATPLEGRDGEVARWFGTCTDIEDQKRTLAQLEHRFEVAQHVSQRLQEASLPRSLPSTRDLQFSATYRAARREASIGGDWFDAMRLIDGRFVLTIGDVLGSGLSAAITMIALRQAMRGAAQTFADPTAILEAADRTLRERQPDGIVTAFVGIYDPATSTFAYASAGHPPPLLRRPGGDIVELSAPGLPLGVRRKGDTEARDVEIEPGAFLALYTDGLIEATHDVCDGERRLRDALARPELAADARAAERIASDVLGTSAADDVAILTVAFAAAETCGAPAEGRWTFDSADRFAARAVQRAVGCALVVAGVAEAHVVDAELVFAELVGNVVRHAPGPCTVALDVDGEAPVLSVLDRGRGYVRSPHLPHAALAETGRGLFIVRSLAFEFAAQARPGGGTIARAVLAAHCTGTGGARRALAAAV